MSKTPPMPYQDPRKPDPYNDPDKWVSPYPGAANSKKTFPKFPGQIGENDSYQARMMARQVAATRTRVQKKATPLRKRSGAQ